MVKKVAKNKKRSVKKKLISEGKISRPATYWALVRKYGKRGHRWRLNPQVRRNWRKNRIKV